MGGTCSDLALAENPCLISTCVKTATRIENKLAWLLRLYPNTSYHGTPVEKVVGTVVVSTDEILQLLSVVKRCVEQSVCPFFSYIYAVGQNCSVERLTHVFKETLPKLRGTLPKKRLLLVLHEPSANTLLQSWMQEPMPFIEKVLILFQLVFSCYVLELANLPYGLTFESLRVSKGEIKKYALYGNTEFVSYFNFETAFQLQVVDYQLLLQSGSNTKVVFTLVQQLFPGVVTKTLPLSVIFINLARWLVNENIVAHTRLPKHSYNVYGIRGSFFANKNLPPFTVNHETKYSDDMRLVMEPVDVVFQHLQTKKHELVKQRLDLESEQKTVQAELQRFRE